MKRGFLGALRGIAFVVALSPGAAWSQSGGLGEDLERLTAPELEGRAAGTAGARLAAAYIEQRFEAAGVEPAGEHGWEVEAEAVAEQVVRAQLRVGEALLASGIEFQVASFSGGGDVQGAPVFVGHGLSWPGWGHDDYAGVDVRGRIVVALTGVPASFEERLAPGAWGRSAEAKSAVALAKGAKALVLVHDARTFGDDPKQRPDQLPPDRRAAALDGIAVVHMTRAVAERVFGAPMVQAEQLAAKGDAPGPRAWSGPEVSLSVRADRRIERAPSLVGRLPGGHGLPIVFMAHFDGLGDGTVGPGRYEGADDNASGVAVMLELARRLGRASPPPRPVYFVATNAEEQEYRGAREVAHFLRQQVRGGLVVNLDMVGRLRRSTVWVEGDAAFLAEVQGVAQDLEIEVKPEGWANSDHVAFREARFRAGYVTTGSHGDFHRTSDTREKLDVSGMERVVELLERWARLGRAWR